MNKKILIGALLTMIGGAAYAADLPSDSDKYDLTAGGRTSKRQADLNPPTTGQTSLEGMIKGGKVTFDYKGKSNQKEANETANDLYNLAKKMSGKEIDNTKFKNWIVISEGQNDKEDALCYDPTKQNLYLQSNCSNYFSLTNAPDIKNDGSKPKPEDVLDDDKKEKPKTSSKNKFAFGIIGSATDNKATTSAYEISNSGKGLGGVVSYDFSTGKDASIKLSVEKIKEDSKTYNIIKDKEAGTMSNTRNTIEAILSKKSDNLSLSGGLKHFDSETSETYGPTNAYSNINLTGIGAGVSYSLGSLTLSYNADVLTHTGQSNSDVKGIISNDYKINYGIAFGEYKSNSFNSTHAGIQQLYDQGIFGAETGIGLEKNGYKLAVKSLQNNGMQADAWGAEANCKLSKRLSIGGSHTQSNREDSNGKTTNSKRSLIKVNYEF